MYIGFILNGRNELEYCRMLSSDVNDLDRRFGEFCFSQVRGQLKGAYLPEERIYCIEAAGEDGNRVEPLVRDIIDRGAWPSDDYQRLRDIGFVHETADSYRRTDSRDFIVGELERTLHNGRAGRLLEAYHDFHQSREKDTGNRVLTAIQTGQGVLLFDDTGRGLERAESYLQYNADNFFSPIHRNTDKLGVYYFSTDNARGWWKRRGSAAGCSPLMTGAVSSPPRRNSSGRTSCGDASPPWSATCPPTSPDTGRC